MPLAAGARVGPYEIAGALGAGGSNGNVPFSVARDGRTLRVQQVHQDQSLTRIEVVLNWFSRFTSAR